MRCVYVTSSSTSSHEHFSWHQWDRSVSSGSPIGCFTLSLRLAAFLQTCPLVECWQLQCHVGLLQRGSGAILTVRSRVWAETFMEVRGLADAHQGWRDETSDSRCRLLNSFSTAATLSSAVQKITLRLIRFNVISISNSCADLICGKQNDAFRFVQNLWQPSFPSVLSWCQWCSSVNSGPTSFTFWSVLFTSLWTRCLIPSLPNSSHLDPER